MRTLFLTLPASFLKRHLLSPTLANQHREYHARTPWRSNNYCQAKVKSSQEKVKEKSQEKEEKDLTLLTVWSSLHHHPPYFLLCHTILPPMPPTLHFSKTSRGPRRQWNIFSASVRRLNTCKCPFGCMWTKHSKHFRTQQKPNQTR